MITLIDPQPFALGRSGAQLYLVEGAHGEPVVMKCATGPFADELAEEARRTDWLRKRTTVPRVLSLGRAQDSCWFTMTRLPGTPGHELPPAWRARGVEELAAALRHLHSQPVGACPFDMRLDTQLARAGQLVRDGRVDEDDFDAARRGRTAQDLLAEALRERPPAEDAVVVHGDCCLSNVLFGEGGRFSGLVDCGRAGVADRHQDLALAARSLHFDWAAPWAQAFLDAYGRHDVDPARLAYYALLDEFF